MKAERQSKRASCDIMAAMRAMHVRLIGKQQSMRLAMGQPGHCFQDVSMDVPRRRAGCSSELGGFGASLIDTCTPTARRRRAKKFLTVAEGEATPLPPYPPPGRG